MKKITLVMAAAMMVASSAVAQKVTKIEMTDMMGEVIQPLGPTSGVANRAWGYNHSKPAMTPNADAEIIYAEDVDLSFATVNLTLAASDEKTKVMADTWEGKKVFNINKEDGTPVEGSIFLKGIKAASLPLTATTTNLNDWTQGTEGWAAAGVMNVAGDIIYEDAVCFKMKAEHALCHYILAFNEEPGELSFLVEGTDVNGSGDMEEVVFDVEESADGKTWTSIVQYVGTDKLEIPAGDVKQELIQKNGSAIPYTTALLPTSRFVRFLYTSSYFRAGMSTDNVILMNATVTEAGATGIKADKASKVMLANTVVRGSLYVVAEQEVSAISVINISGTEVASSTNTKVMDVTSLATGCYIARVMTADGNTNIVRFIKK